MRLVLGLTAAIAAAAGCGGLPVAPGPAYPASVALSPDGRSAIVDIIGAPDPDDPRQCAGVYGATATFADEVMTVEAWGAEWNSEKCKLDVLVCCDHRITIELPDGFVPRAVKVTRASGDRGQQVFLYRPARGLVDLEGLQVADLVSEGSDWSPTGTWYRNYHLPGKEKTIDLRQIFGGAWGREPEQVVGLRMIHGMQGELSRWAELDEIQLTWPVGDDTLVLFGHERDFSADDLVALAESALPPSP